jgi:hypothetical protein
MADLYDDLEDADHEFWKQRLAYARNIELQTDYALFSTAVQLSPAVTVDAAEDWRGREDSGNCGKGAGPFSGERGPPAGAGQRRDDPEADGPGIAVL